MTSNAAWGTELKRHYDEYLGMVLTNERKDVRGKEFFIKEREERKDALSQGIEEMRLMHAVSSSGSVVRSDVNQNNNQSSSKKKNSKKKKK
jgi:hypothetical protein